MKTPGFPLVTGLVLTVSVFGCAPEDDGIPPLLVDDPSSPFMPVADVYTVMESILEPAAETYWDAVGWIIDFDGEHEIVPETDEEWEAVRDAAYVIAESGNLLMMRGRAPDGGPWNPMAQAMIETARRGIAAAEARDRDAVFDAGAEIYFTCTGCHSIYAVETLRPSARPEGAGADDNR